MADDAFAGARARNVTKFDDPRVTADGAERASVSLRRLKTLWFNTGTLCNIECAHCYIHSSPTNDALVYLTPGDVTPFLDEIQSRALPTEAVGFTGGEPFLNPDVIVLIEDALRRGFETIVLTNAMRPMQRPRIQAGLLALKARHGAALRLRVSLDHYDAQRHESERGRGSWAPAADGLGWLAREGFAVSVAGRLRWPEMETELRRGYATLFRDMGIDLDANDPGDLVLFPEMDDAADTPEITTACWDLLGKHPDEVMCASERMVVKRKGADGPVVLPCTLLTDDPQFELGATLMEADRPVRLNHPHCSRFCVLGGASCSQG